LASIVVTKDNPVFSDTQAPKAGELLCQRGNVAFLSGVYVIKGAPNILPDTGMQVL
jgi:hypothetical protein